MLSPLTTSSIIPPVVNRHQTDKLLIQSRNPTNAPLTILGVTGQTSLLGVGITNPFTALSNCASSINDGATGTIATGISWLVGGSGFGCSVWNATNSSLAHGLLVKCASQNSATKILACLAGSNVSVLTVLGNGNVGIGVAAPSVNLHTLSTAEQFRAGYDASNYMSVTVASAGSTTFALTGTTPTFSFSQSVGVGLTSPSDKINIGAGNLRITTTIGASTGEFGRVCAYNTLGTLNEAASIAFLRDDGTDGFYGALQFTTKTNERMRITSSGTVGIGTGSTVSAKLHTISTTEQLRAGYDASNYMSVTTGSTGSTTFALTGTSPTFTFSQNIGIGGPTTSYPILITAASDTNDASKTQIYINSGTDGTLGPLYLILGSHPSATGTSRYNYIGCGDNVGIRALALNCNGGGVFGSVGCGTTSPSARLHTLSTAEQFRVGYDASNYMSVTTGSAGSTTFALTGTSPTFTFSQSLLLTAKITTYNNIATVSNGVPSELATIDLATQSAAVSTASLYTPAATGLFRISAYLQVTRAATSSSTLGTVTITYTDGDGSVAQSVVMGLNTATGAIATSSAGNSTTTNLNGGIEIYAKTGVAIQYAIGYASTGGTSMQYAAHLKVEAL